MAQNRALGLGLVAAGAVLGGLLVLNLLVNLVSGQLQAGGAVLGLMLAAVLGLPLIGSGLYVLSRGKQEAAEAEAFRTQRQTFEADRLFRAEQARELEQLARRLDGLAGPDERQLAARLRDVVHDLQAPAYDQAAWYEAVDLGRADVEALRRYDEVLTSGLRALRDLVDQVEAGEPAQAELQRAARAWERDLDRRTALLLGRPAPEVAPTDVLRAGRTTGTADAVAALKPGDAITWDFDDYLVETSTSYFISGRTWWLHRLEAQQDERWLLIGPGGLRVARLQPSEQPLAPGPSTLQVDGIQCQLEETGTAAARIQTRSGPGSSGAVTIWRYTCPGERLIWIERWPESARAYSGTELNPSELEIWPAASDPEASAQA